MTDYYKLNGKEVEEEVVENTAQTEMSNDELLALAKRITPSYLMKNAGKKGGISRYYISFAQKWVCFTNGFVMIVYPQEYPNELEGRVVFYNEATKSLEVAKAKGAKWMFVLKATLKECEDESSEEYKLDYNTINSWMNNLKKDKEIGKCIKYVGDNELFCMRAEDALILAKAMKEHKVESITLGKKVYETRRGLFCSDNHVLGIAMFNRIKEVLVDDTYLTLEKIENDKEDMEKEDKND